MKLYISIINFILEKILWFSIINFIQFYMNYFYW